MNETVQSFCEVVADENGNNPRHPQVLDLKPANVFWFKNKNDSVALDEKEFLENNTTYFARSKDSSCSEVAAVEVFVFDSPSAGAGTRIYLSANDSVVDLVPLLNPATAGPADSGGRMIPSLKHGGTLFDPALEANWTGTKRFRHFVASNNDICPDDATFVYINISPYENTSHHFINLGNVEEEALVNKNNQNFMSSAEVIPVNIWKDQPLEVGAIYRIKIQNSYSFYYVDSVKVLSDMNPALTLTKDTEMIKITNVCENLITGINGNVGIGTDNSGDYGLSVGSSIYTDEVKVMDVDTWPDYVFSSGYDLMNLQRLESYIKSYGHLPEVPSSEEVFSNGISLAEMDKVNLKKLEELSLYLIDQHNRLQELDAVKENVTVPSKSRANLSAWVERSGIVSSLPTIDSLSLGLSCQGDNIGINTSNTGGYRLGVTGGILSEGVKVESVSNWPDYVFSADYSLRSLDELEAYIEANRHLPGLPSAKAIESDGYSLSEMDRLLMEKVEELTLYIIGQERHLTELSKELGIDFPTKSHKWPGTSENLLAENSESHYKDYPKNEVQILAEVSGTFTSPLCDAISCNGEEVGIGTDPLEGYLLAVAGGILTDDIRVASVSNWPDYVFEADYKLRDLSDLSNYIESKGHLPGVPKAEVVEQEGYRLETMDALLLEKIEELTLYLIEQERQVTFLEEHSVKQ